MSNRNKYPRIDLSKRIYGNPLCEHCQESPATHLISIRYRWSREGNEEYRVCARGLLLAERGDIKILKAAIENTRSIRSEVTKWT
jgi:hypothetical protein